MLGFPPPLFWPLSHFSKWFTYLWLQWLTKLNAQTISYKPRNSARQLEVFQGKHEMYSKTRKIKSVVFYTHFFFHHTEVHKLWVFLAILWLNSIMLKNLGPCCYPDTKHTTHIAISTKHKNKPEHTTALTRHRPEQKYSWCLLLDTRQNYMWLLYISERTNQAEILSVRQI